MTSGYVDLQVHPTDEYFPDQWNLAVTDVPDAWRFTTGSGSVLLVSMDTALPAKVAGDSDLDAGQVNTELLPKDSSGNPVYLRLETNASGALLDNDGEPIVNLTNGSISPVSLSKSPQLLIGAGSNLVDTNAPRSWGCSPASSPITPTDPQDQAVDIRRGDLHGPSRCQ